MGQASIAVGTKTDSYELTFPSELKVRSEVLAVGHDSAGSMVQIAYAIAGSSLEPVTVTRGYLYSVRVRFVATDRNGKGGCARSIRLGTSLRRPRCPAGEHLVGRAAVARASGEVRLPAGDSAGRGVRRRAATRHGPRRPADLDGPRPQRPRARQPLDESVLAPHRRRHRHLQSAPDLQAEPGYGSLLRGRGIDAREHRTRFESRCGSRVAVAGCSRRSSAAGRRPCHSSSRSKVPFRWEALTATSSSRPSNRGTIRSRWWSTMVRVGPTARSQNFQVVEE